MGHILLSICAVVVAGLLCGSQQPPQAQQDPRDQNSAASENAPVRAVEAEGDRQGSASQDEPQDQPGPLERADLTAQQAMALFAGLQVVLTFFGLLYIRWTLIETRKAVKEASDATAAAHAAVDITRSSTEKQLRAYVTIRHVLLTDFEVGKVPRTEIRIHNTGATPARKIQMRMELQRCSDWEKRPCHFLESTACSNLELGADCDTTQGLGVDLLELHREHKESFHRGEWGYIIFGWIKYRDVFGRLQRLTVRGYFDTFSDLSDDGDLVAHVSPKGLRST